MTRWTATAFQPEIKFTHGWWTVWYGKSGERYCVFSDEQAAREFLTLIQRKA